MILITLAALLAQTFGGAGSASPAIVLQRGHGANISALAFSPDGKFLASASEDSTIKLWNPETGAEIRTLRGHSNIVTALALSADGSLIASASLDHTLRVWTAATGEIAAVLRGPQPSVYLLKITPDSQSLVTVETVASGSIVRVWDIKTGRLIHLIKRDEAAVSQVFFSGSDMYIAEESGEDDSTGSLTTYNFHTGKLLHTRREMLCGVSGNGKWIAVDRSTVSARQAVIVDLARDRPLAVLSGQVSRVAFSHNGEWLAYESTAGDTAVVRRTEGGQAHIVHGRGAEFSMLALSPDGRWLASAGADFSVHVWNVATGKLATAMPGQYTPTALAFSPDGRHIALNGGSTDLGLALEIWDIERRAEVFAPHFKRPVAAIAYNKDGSYLAVSSSSLEVFETRTGASLAKLDCSSGPELFPTFSPNGKWIAANCSGVITVWSLSTAAELFHFGAPSDPNAGPLAFSPDGRYLAAASSNGVFLYDVAARKVAEVLPTADPPSALAFSPNSELLAFGLHLRSPKPGEELATLFMFDIRSRRHVWSEPFGQWISAIHFERDGRALLIAGGEDLHRFGSLQIIQANNGKTIHHLAIRVPDSATVAFSPDGEWFAAGWNSAANIWRLPAR